MKYGINTLLFEAIFNNQSARKFSRIKKIGFDGIEIALQEKGLEYVNDLFSA